MGTIVRRGPGQYQAKIRRTGINKIISKTFDTLGEAETWLAIAEGKLAAGDNIMPPPSSKMTLADLLGLYRDDDEISQKKGYRQVKNRINRIMTDESQMCGMALKKMTASDFLDYKKRRLVAVSAYTVRLEMAILRHALNKAVLWGHLGSNPFVRGIMPAPPSGRTRRVKEKDLELLRKYLSTEMIEIVDFAIETAMRRGEIVNMLWKHVDLKNFTLVIPEAKAGSRTIPLSPKALEILKKRRATAVIPVDPETPATVWSITNADTITHDFIAAVKASGLTNLRFHDLRHEATSRLSELGTFNILEIAEITGHKTMQMLKRYSHGSAAALAKKLAQAKQS